MNQKKYLLVSAGVHGALLLVLLILPACFLTPKKPQPRALKINLQSSASIEAVLRQQTLQTTPTPPAPEPVEPEPVKIQPPKPKPKPVPKPEKSRKKSAPAPPKPKIKSERPPQTKPKKSGEIEIDFSKKVDRKQTPTQTAEKAQRQREGASKAAQDRQEAIRQKLEALSGQNFSAPYDIAELGGDNTLENWGQFVRKSYNKAWQLVKQPEVSNSRSTVKVKVVINLDGSVASAQIVQPSGIDDLDRSVQDALNRVRKIGKKPPSKASIKDRTFTIAFNLKNGRINTE